MTDDDEHLARINSARARTFRRIAPRLALSAIASGAVGGYFILTFDPAWLRILVATFIIGVVSVGFMWLAFRPLRELPERMRRGVDSA
jgi:hypothetical protein